MQQQTTNPKELGAVASKQHPPTNHVDNYATSDPLLAWDKLAKSCAASRPQSRQRQGRMPPYGRQLMELRQAGHVPHNSVAVVFDWKDGGIFPRIVITDEVPIENLELRFLAGLDVIIAYRDKDSSRVHELAQAILRVNPRILQAFAIDIPKTTILKNSAGQVMI